MLHCQATATDLAPPYSSRPTRRSSVSPAPGHSFFSSLPACRLRNESSTRGAASEPQNVSCQVCDGRAAEGRVWGRLGNRPACLAPTGDLTPLCPGQQNDYSLVRPPAHQEGVLHSFLQLRRRQLQQPRKDAVQTGGCRARTHRRSPPEGALQLLWLPHRPWCCCRHCKARYIRAAQGTFVQQAHRAASGCRRRRQRRRWRQQPNAAQRPFVLLACPTCTAATMLRRARALHGAAGTREQGSPHPAPSPA